MKSLLIGLSIFSSLSLLAAPPLDLESSTVTSGDILNCSCKFKIGPVDLPEFQSVAEIAISLDDEGGALSSAGDAEVEIKVAYACLLKFKEKNGVSKVLETKSVRCEFEDGPDNLK